RSLRLQTQALSASAEFSNTHTMSNTKNTDTSCIDPSAVHEHLADIRYETTAQRAIARASFLAGQLHESQRRDVAPGMVLFPSLQEATQFSQERVEPKAKAVGKWAWCPVS